GMVCRVSLSSVLRAAVRRVIHAEWSHSRPLLGLPSFSAAPSRPPGPANRSTSWAGRTWSPRCCMEDNDFNGPHHYYYYGVHLPYCVARTRCVALQVTVLPSESTP